VPGLSIGSLSTAESPAGDPGFVAVEVQTKVWSASPAAASDPIAEAPTLQWYAMPPGAANQYGPATGEEFRAWMKEGRIPAEALVWRQDWPDWKRAGSVFPQLATLAAPAPPLTAPAAPVIPTAATAVPMTPGMPPLAQPAFPMPGPAPGMFPTGGEPADAFPVMPTEPPRSTSTAGRSRAYRPRSNTGPIIAIVVLLLAMIPLTFFVWKVVSEQIVSPAPPATTSADGNSADGNSEAGNPPPAGSNEEEE
jgi:hypothetical protein